MVEILNLYIINNFFLQNNHFFKNESIITKHDSTTRSVIDPAIIVTSPNNSISQSIMQFNINHCQPIINVELNRGNYRAVKTLTPKSDFNTSKNYFKGNYDWLLITLILLIIVLTWVKISYNKAINQTFASTINQQSARKLIAEKSNLLQKASVFLIVIYIFTSAIFIFEIINFYNINLINFSGFKLFLICLIGFAVFFITKNILYWLSGVLFNTEKYIADFRSNCNIFLRSAGIIILPIVFAIPYVTNYIAQILIYIGFLMFAISFILRIFRGFILSFQNKLSLFYSFLYFCTLEILPLIYVYYYIKKFGNV